MVKPQPPKNKILLAKNFPTRAELENKIRQTEGIGIIKGSQEELKKLSLSSSSSIYGWRVEIK